MLFVPRFANQSIMIGDEIEIKISRIDDTSVCLGIQAPRELPITRKEEHKKLREIVRKSKPQYN